mgnify:CR=1 FL=1|tara:strand:+ start:113 stop:397 length:285 start_codon:yes stop_codon:yes gene_type:complete
MEDLRLIANPAHLREIEVTVTKKCHKQSKDKLYDLLRDRYDNIYLSCHTIKHIGEMIDNEIEDIIETRCVNNCMEYILTEVIEQNKFDFCLPFD